MSKEFEVSEGFMDIVKIMGRPVYYRLNADHTTEPATRQDGLQAFQGDRHVAKTEVGDASVSTVFLVIDHQFGDGPPILFETMVFGGDRADENQWRYLTWDEAAAGHDAVVSALRDGTELP